MPLEERGEVIRCAWCGARNYAIDMWCARCHGHLDSQPVKRRWRGPLATILPTGAALAGVAIALAAASWFSGSLQFQFVFPRLPTTGPAAETVSAQAQNLPGSIQTLRPTPASGRQTAAGSAPPGGATAKAPLSSVAKPPQLQPAADPAAAVQRFYAAVSAHQFDLAASLWSPQMKAAYPPSVYIDQRFSTTQQIGLRSERVLADGGGTAVIGVDLLEQTAGQTREWVGTWQLIQVASGWLLNSADLQGA